MMNYYLKKTFILTVNILTNKFIIKIIIFENISGDANNNLFLFQYPLRPNDRFYGDHGDIFNVTINKPEKSAIKIHYKVDPKNQFSDKNFQEHKVIKTIK